MIVNWAGVFGNLRYIMANKGESCFFRIHFLDTCKPLNCPGFCDVAPDTVNSVCRVNNNTTLFQDFNNLANVFWIGIFRCITGCTY